MNESILHGGQAVLPVEEEVGWHGASHRRRWLRGDVPFFSSLNSRAKWLLVEMKVSSCVCGLLRSTNTGTKTFISALLPAGTLDAQGVEEVPGNGQSKL